MCVLSVRFFVAHVLGVQTARKRKTSACPAEKGLRSPLANGTPLHPIPAFHGQRSRANYSPWGRKESDITEHTHGLHRCAISESSFGWQYAAWIVGMGWEEPRTMPSNTVVTRHLHFKLNRIKNFVFQLFQHFKCSAATCGWWLPY